MNTIKKITTLAEAKEFVNAKDTSPTYLGTQELANKARNGFRVYINGSQKSHLQIRNMKGKSFSVYTSEIDGVKIMETTNCDTLKR